MLLEAATKQSKRRRRHRHKKVQPCNSWVPGEGFSFPRKHHFFFDDFLSWISAINKPRCWGKTFCVRKPGGFGWQEMSGYEQSCSCAFQLFDFQQLQKTEEEKKEIYFLLPLAVMCKAILKLKVLRKCSGFTNCSAKMLINQAQWWSHYRSKKIR